MVKGKRRSRDRKATACALLSLVLFFSFYPLPLVLFPLSPVHAARNDSAVVSTDTPEGRLSVFDDAWERINERYYDRKFHGLDWDTQRTTFRPLAAKAETSRELYTVLRRMIAPLNDPHTRVFAPEEKFDWWRPRYVTVGISIGEVAGLPTVTKVDRNSAPHRAGLRAGDIIEDVDGEAATSLIKKRLADLPDADSASSRLRVFAKLLEGSDGTPVRLTWKNKNGKLKSSTFVRFWQERELGVRMRREHDYGVIEIEAFTKSIAIAFARELKQKLSGVRGLVIDLRSNGGGDAEAMSEVASTFFGVDTDLGRFTDREGTSFTISTRYRSLLTSYTVASTGIPLVVLTSERTASAAEIFVEALRDSRRATIIGTETCGCVLAVRTRHLLPDGGLLDVSELDYETAHGQRIEGHGLQPDEGISVERSDLYAGRDRAMDRAFDKLTRAANTTR
jgi:carboxyl-terminal processing protease